MTPTGAEEEANPGVAGVSRGSTSALGQVALVFFKLGSLAFGGPAAHIAMMEHEIVRLRGWLDRSEFMDLVGATNLIPGPNSTEMAIHIGYRRAGWKGLIVAGLCFILPAVTITLLLAQLYLRFGSLPQMSGFVNGLRPATVAVIIATAYRLSSSVRQSILSLAILFGVGTASLLGVNEIVLLLGGGALAALWENRGRLYGMAGLFLVRVLPAGPAAAMVSGTVAAPTAAGLGFIFLKIGSVLYGSGYVLVAFLQSELVESRHWLTQTQLLDAVSAGMFTPGPVLSTATFIGYLLLGLPGATVATIGIFLPSFIFVAISGPFILRLRRLPFAKGFLDGVNASALGLMLAVSFRLASQSFHAPAAWGLFVAAAAVQMYWKVNPAWVVFGAGMAGLLLGGAGWVI